MSTVRIVTDSACDLSDEEIATYAVQVVPLSIRFGDQEYVDRQDLSAQQFWAKVAATPMLPETAAPSPGAFEQAFRTAAADGASGVVCVVLSSKLSATYGSAQLGAKAVAGLIDVRVVDSLSITSGLGTMCIVAARQAHNGASLDEVEASARSLVGRTRVYGGLDTLDNLKKGGRIGGAQALIGSLLSIRPIIDISTGEVEQLGKQRTRAKVFAQLLLQLTKAQADFGGVENVAVMHGDANDIEDFLQLLSASYPRNDIRVGQIGAVIGTHGGPGVMGLTFNLPVSP